MSRRGRVGTAASHAATTGLLVCAALLPWSACMAQTQSWVPGKGMGSVSMAYQDLYIAAHTLSDGTRGYPGSINNHSVFLDFDYGLTDRLAVHVSLPFKSNRFVGPGVHNPGSLDDDHGESFLDDGRYHSGWQNWNVALRYQWFDKALKVTPFVSFGYPSHDYTTFAHATVGTGQKHLQFGINAGRRFAPPMQNLFVQLGYAYSIMEKMEDRQVNHSTFNAEFGWFATPRLTLSLLATAQKTYNGFDFPQDYPINTDEHYYHHDQNLRNDFINVGAAASFQMTRRYSSFLTYGHTVWGENAHLIHHAWTLGVSRSF